MATQDQPRPKMVPELYVTDIAASLRFWCGLLGFRIRYDRPEDGFAFLEREGTEMMLEQLDNESWLVGMMERPFGRGINFEIATSGLAPLLEALGAANWPLYLAPQERWYRAGAVELGQRQVVLQDPDGYLLRFTESLGERPAAGHQQD